MVISVAIGDEDDAGISREDDIVVNVEVPEEEGDSGTGRSSEDIVTEPTCDSSCSCIEN
ncbi:hypothetical protein SERLA73DRAFT_187835 [Serpula lacrymans var. lacrymans S7.3]|uniref:Uncharacterized protein n=2 Tax=Serpula lacrymans var. lacrymans TaxID=341189 RepID=F8QAI9_SERL3|nr:uncharacterized protein SERLADRAFT_477703 [Serpula lacrymans var. lacrymans S7.9]EGN94779.1 hypothetical protein SERLA73DRAFT_187835 [Serpula lacrymans var. lacrymans S7.3]EGO20281.1 hypothetical protein SERLADRAFT_477703 [Serpula lacrymans var. lacrymans S7.9]